MKIQPYMTVEVKDGVTRLTAFSEPALGEPRGHELFVEVLDPEKVDVAADMLASAVFEKEFPGSMIGMLRRQAISVRDGGPVIPKVDQGAWRRYHQLHGQVSEAVT